MADRIIARDEARAQGLSRFFTGIACRNGHLSERGVSHGKCIRCITEHSKQFGERNPERRKEQTNRAWRKHAPKNNEYRKGWRQRNRDRILGQERERRLENPEINRRNALKWRNENLERARASANKWYADNPDKATIIKNRRRARKNASGGTYTAEDAKAIFASQNHRCAYCRADLRKVKKHLDHVLPLALGGTNDKSNLQWLCQECNLSKGAKHPVTFAQELGLLL